MNHNDTRTETNFVDCLTCNTIKEEAPGLTTSVCETCGDDYVITPGS